MTALPPLEVQVSPRVRATRSALGTIGPIRYTHANGQPLVERDALAIIARDHHISIIQAREVVKREFLHAARRRGEWR